MPDNSLIVKTRLPELDAVRAFAVVIVVLFHLKVIGFGYLGVDIFFVLSGYLMTRNVLQEQQHQGKVSVKTFIKKRFLRIVPSFVIVGLASAIVAILIYSPLHLKDFGEQLLRALTFSSNFLFYDQAGYFSPENELRPLLHSWSLSVEEQFYILFALLIFLTKFFRFRNLILCTFAISLLLYGALCFQTLGGNFDPSSIWPETEKGEDATFYLTPFRMIQFLSGACLALIHCRHRPKFGAWAGSFLLIFALGLLYVTHASQLLIFSNLLASISAIALLQKNRVSAWLGGLRAVQFFAKSSYQIYLVHWPLIVFWHYITLEDLSLVSQVGLGLMSLLLGWALMRATHKISNPSNFHRLPKHQKLSGLIILIVTIGLAFAGIKSDGLPSRVPSDRHVTGAVEQREIESAYCNGSHSDENGRSFGNRLGDPLISCDVNPQAEKTIYILGDSHARALVPGLAKSYPGYRIAVMYFTSCHAQSGIDQYIYDYEGRRALKEACVVRNRNAMKLFAEIPKSAIIIHQFAGYHSDKSPEFYKAGAEQLRQLQLMGHDVVWLGSVVRPNKLLEGCNVLPASFPAR